MPVSPARDRMAAERLRLADAYANSAVRSPTRVALMTGRWQYRVRGGAGCLRCCAVEAIPGPTISVNDILG